MNDPWISSKFTKFTILDLLIPLPGIILILFFEILFNCLSKTKPSIAFSFWPDVKTLSIPNSIRFSISFSGLLTLSNALWNVNSRGLDNSTNSFVF